MKNHIESLTTTATAVVLLAALIATIVSLLASGFGSAKLTVDSNQFPVVLSSENVEIVTVRPSGLVLADWNDPVSGIQNFLSSKIKMAPQIS